MAIRLSRKHHAQLLEWAQAAEKAECCGLLMGNGETIREIELTDNVAADTTQHFEIDPAALIRRHRQSRNGGLPVIGCFHSHPNGLAHPSKTDAMQAADNGQCWLIIAAGEITAWKPNGSFEFEPVALIVEG